jgi:hypothetical protein
MMVSNRNSEGVVDPKIPEMPSSRSLKKALLVALRCVDPESRKRPKIGHVIHMLEVDDFPYREVIRTYFCQTWIFLNCIVVFFGELLCLNMRLIHASHLIFYESLKQLRCYFLSGLMIFTLHLIP